MTQNLENKTQMNLPGMENITEDNQNYSKPRMSNTKKAFIATGIIAGALTIGTLIDAAYRFYDDMKTISGVMNSYGNMFDTKK